MLAPTISPIDRDRWFAGTLLRIIADASDTGGALTVMEQRAGRGFSPPFHVHHREDTALLILEAPVAELPPASAPDVERLLAAVGPYGVDIVGPPMS